MISDEELKTAIDVALLAADAASSIINRSISERATMPLDIGSKSNSVDMVTQYDKQCEEEVLAILQRATPNYSILSEESRADAELGDGPTWVVDPIDGTTSFVHGLYDCCVSIALVVNKEPILGVVSAPRLQEVFVGVKGRGAFCNGQRIHVSSTQRLEEAVVFLHASYNRSRAAVDSHIGMLSEFAKVPVHTVRNNGAAALDMCLVAAGRADLYLEVGIHAWDYAAGTIIVREAGGYVHDTESTENFDLMRCGMCCGSTLELTRKAVELSKKYNYRENVLKPQSTHL